MQKLKALFILSGCLLLNSNTLRSKKCKEYDSVVVKCALTVCGNINGVRMGKLLAYGSFINNANGTIVVATGDDIPFTTDTISPVNISHNAGTFTTITIQKSGIYSVFYKIQDATGFITTTQVYLNGAPVLGTDDSGLTATVDNSLFQANAGDVLSLRNIGPSFTLLTPSGTTPPAGLVLIRIA